MKETESQRRRRRWITLGEIIGIAALIVSGLGLWLNWKSSNEDRPTRIVEQRQAIPLALRGKAVNDGRQLEIAPVEPSHGLESLMVTIKGSPPIEVGSDGMLDASEVARALKDRKEGKGSLRILMQIQARYVEAGADRRGGGTYILQYRWEGGGLFGGRSLRLTGFSKA